MLTWSTLNYFEVRVRIQGSREADRCRCRTVSLEEDQRSCDFSVQEREREHVQVFF